jgi:hypothetical protein
MAKEQRQPGERDAGDPEGVRDFQRGGDLGEGGHSAFGKETGSGTQHNDERLGNRGRNPGRDESAFLEDIDSDRRDAREGSDVGPGQVRGLTPPDRDDVGA